MTSSQPLDRLAARQRKSQVYAQAKREHLTPLQAERADLIKTIETTLANFIAGALPDLEAATLEPFEQAVRDNMLDVGPTALAQNLRSQSETANKLAKRYEREFSIYTMAEYLPDEERKLSAIKARVMETQRSYERLEIELEPLGALNDKLAALKLPAVTVESAAQYTRSHGLSHYTRLLSDKAYRTAWPVIAPIEASGETLASKLNTRLALHQSLLILQQEADVQEAEVSRQRMWVEAFVMAWTSRLSEKQIVSEVRQAMADYMHEKGFRNNIAARFERRYPETLDALFDKIEELDSKTRRFLLGFDANYEAGRIEVAEELSTRQRVI